MTHHKNSICVIISKTERHMEKDNWPKNMFHVCRNACNFILCVCYYCSILIKFGICQQILVKLPSIIINENPFSSSQVVSSKQTDRHSKVYFYIIVNIPKNWYVLMDRLCSSFCNYHVVHLESCKMYWFCLFFCYTQFFYNRLFTWFLKVNANTHYMQNFLLIFTTVSDNLFVYT
jgi:hypothetical protein